MRALNQRKSKCEEESRNQVVSNIQSYLLKRGYRADLVLIASVRDTTGPFSAEVKFNGRLGYPSEKDVMAIISKSYPKHSIDWDTVELDTDSSVITINLEPSVEIIPLKNISEIPPDFKSIGTAIYKRAADTIGEINEVWTLRKDEHGLALCRNHDDVEITTDDEEKLVAGSIVDTPKGVGKVVRFDDDDNAIVLIGNMRYLFASSDMKPYKQEKEKTELEKYYEEAYGDKEYGKKMTEDFSTKKK
jgi:hypothetical protein